MTIATGTAGKHDSRFVAQFVAPHGTPVQSGATMGNTQFIQRLAPLAEVALNGDVVKGKGSLTFPVNEPSSRGERIRTSDLLNPFRKPGEQIVRKTRSFRDLEFSNLLMKYKNSA